MTSQDRCISYGRLGLSRYELQESRWLFCRQVRSAELAFSPVSLLAQVIYPEQIGSAIQRHGPDDHRSDSPALSALLRDVANLAPALRLLPQLDQVSEVIQESETAINGSLMAIGSILDRYHKARLGILVSAGGPAARYLRFDILEPFNFQCRTSVQQEGLVAYKIQDVTPAWFDCGGDPVLQVIFSDSVTDWGDILAVRHQNRIAILHPFASQHATWHPASQGFQPQGFFSFSRVHPGYLADIRPTGQDHSDLAHVSFNPWQATEIAAINTTGLLNVWKLRPENSKPFSNEPTELLLTSRLSGDMVTGSDYDGWGRILWAHDGKTLVIARRRNLALLQTNQSSVIIPTTWTSNQVHEKDNWILEIDRCPTRPDVVVLLTRWNLMFVKIVYSAHSVEGSERLPTGEIILSMPHHQLTESIRLHMTIVADGNVIIALLHRTDSEVLVVFTFTWDTRSDLLRFRSNSNAIKISLWAGHLIDSIRQERRHVHGMAVRNLSLIPVVKASAVKPHSFGQHWSGDQGYAQMVVLTPDLRAFDVTLALYERATPELATEVKSLRSQSRSPISSFRVKDPFLVEDEVASDETLLSKDKDWNEQQHNARQIRRQDIKRIWKPLGRLLMRAAETCFLAMEKDATSSDSSLPSESRVRIPPSSNRLYTKNEVLKRPATFADVGNASSAASSSGGYLIPDGLISLEVGALLTLGSEALPLVGLNSFMLQNAGFDDPAVICERLAATCVWPLPDFMPSHTRIVLNTLIRRISLHIVSSVAGIVVFQDEWRVRRAAEELLGSGSYSNRESHSQDGSYLESDEQTSGTNILNDLQSLDPSIKERLALNASWSTYPVASPLLSCLGVLEDADDFRMLDIICEHWSRGASSEGNMPTSTTSLFRKRSSKQKTGARPTYRTHLKSATTSIHQNSSLNPQDTFIRSVSQLTGSQPDACIQHFDRNSSQNNQVSQRRPNISTSEEAARPTFSFSQSQPISQSLSLFQKQTKKRKAGFR